METHDATPLEIVGSDAVNAIERGQIDMQIATAKRYPRSIKVFMDEAKTMIGLNQETAEACNYRLKRKGKDGMKIIEGPSIRLLEIAASAYTNLRFGSRIIGEDDNYVTAQGFAFDVQKNVAIAVEVKRSIRTSDGRRYSVDMIGVVSNAAGSIARRNALNGGGIPRAYINELAAHAKKIAVGDQKTVKERLQKAFEYFTQVMGVELSRVLAYLEKPSIDDCGLPEIEELQGLKTMLKEDGVKLDDVFPDPNAPKSESPDLTGQQRPDLGQQKQGQTQSVPQNSPTVPQTMAPVPQNQGSVPQNVTPLPVQGQSAPAPATEAAAKPTRQRKPAPPEPQPEAPSAPAVSQVAPAATPEPPANEVNLNPQQKADALDEKLAGEGVEVDEFFSWCKSSGRDRKYKFDPDKCGSVGEAPQALIDDLSANGYAGLAPCIRTFGTAAKDRANAGPVTAM